MGYQPRKPVPPSVRDAFYLAVQLYPSWTPAEDKALVSIDGQHWTIGQICELAAGIGDPMPDILLGNLMLFLAAEDEDLMEDLAKDRSYAGGARYLLKLMDRRRAANAP